MGSERQMTLGEFLRTEREQRGITLEQVASATKVGIRTLHALEADQYSELPAKPYIRGFVSSYCSFIGLDPSEVRAKYDDFIDQKSTERPHREAGHSGYAFEKKDGQQQSRILLFISMCTFLIVGAIAVIFFKPALKHRKSSHLEKLKSAQEQEVSLEQSHAVVVAAPSASPSPGGVAHVTLPGVETLITPSPLSSILPEKRVEQGSQRVESVPEVKGGEHFSVGPMPHSVGPVPKAHLPLEVAPPPVVQPTVPQAGGPIPIPSVTSNPKDPLDSGHEVALVEVKHHLVVKVLGDVWVRYRVDDRQTRKFVIRAGRSLVLRARERIIFQVSDPASVTVVYNQKGSPEWVSESSRLKRIHGEATLIYSSAPVHSAGEILQDQKPLLKKVEPKSERSH